jgi:hypothetical protein
VSREAERDREQAVDAAVRRLAPRAPRGFADGVMARRHAVARARRRARLFGGAAILAAAAAVLLWVRQREDGPRWIVLEARGGGLRAGEALRAGDGLEVRPGTSARLRAPGGGVVSLPAGFAGRLDDAGLTLEAGAVVVDGPAGRVRAAEAEARAAAPSDRVRVTVPERGRVRAVVEALRGRVAVGGGGDVLWLQAGQRADVADGRARLADTPAARDRVAEAEGEAGADAPEVGVASQAALAEGANAETKMAPVPLAVLSPLVAGLTTRELSSGVEVPGEGNPPASVTVVALLDLSTGDWAEVLAKGRSVLGRRPLVRLVPLLLASDRRGEETAKTIGAALGKGRFWDALDRLAVVKGPFDRARLEDVWRDLGLEMWEFRQAVERGAVRTPGLLRRSPLPPGSRLWVEEKQVDPAELERAVDEELRSRSAPTTEAQAGSWRELSALLTRLSIGSVSSVLAFRGAAPVLDLDVLSEREWFPYASGLGRIDPVWAEAMVRALEPKIVADVRAFAPEAKPPRLRCELDACGLESWNPRPATQAMQAAVARLYCERGCLLHGGSVKRLFRRDRYLDMTTEQQIQRILEHRARQLEELARPR